MTAADQALAQEAGELLAELDGDTVPTMAEEDTLCRFVESELREHGYRGANARIKAHAPRLIRGLLRIVRAQS